MSARGTVFMKKVLPTLLLLVAAATAALCLAATSGGSKGGKMQDKGGPVFETRLATAFEAAKAEGKPLVVVFSAKWCPPCQEMRREVYPSAQIQPYHDKFVWAYIDAAEPRNRPDIERAGVGPLPDLRFLDKDGRVVGHHIGPLDSAGLEKQLRKALKKSGD